MSELLDYFMKMMLFDNFRRISTKMFSKVRKLSNVDFLVKEKRVKNRDIRRKVMIFDHFDEILIRV